MCKQKFCVKKLKIGAQEFFHFVYDDLLKLVALPGRNLCYRIRVFTTFADLWCSPLSCQHLGS